MRLALQYIGSIFKGRGIKLLLAVLFVCITLSAEAQLNPFSRQKRSERTIIRGGQIYTPDSLEVRHADSVRIAKLVDTLRKIAPDSLKNIDDKIRMQLPDSLRTQIFGGLQRDSLAIDSLAVDTTLTERQRKRLERRENRTPFISDSMSLRNVCLTSAVLPGFGQSTTSSTGSCLYSMVRLVPRWDYVCGATASSNR